MTRLKWSSKVSRRMNEFSDLHSARMAATWNLSNPKAVFELPLFQLDSDMLVDAASRLRGEKGVTFRSLVMVNGSPWLLVYREGSPVVEHGQYTEV